MARFQTEPRRRASPLLPSEDSREAALFFVIAALCFLGALAALISRGAYDAAQNWTAEVEGELTVLVRDTDQRGAQEAADALKTVVGVEESRLLSREEVVALLEQSFGRGGVPDGLPVPKIIAVRGTVDLAGGLQPRIERRLAELGVNARVEDHAAWAKNLRAALSGVRWAGLGTVALLVATAVAVIASATHANLLARRDIVEVLHLSGARDRYIAGLFERRFWLLGLRAGGVGALLALGAAALLVFASRNEGGQNLLLPRLDLKIYDALILLSAPILAALASRVTASFTVMSTLSAEGQRA